jgi:hypothetical protein
MKSVDGYTDQQKVDFFDANWEYIDRILNVLQSEKFGYIRAGKFLLEWLAEYLEREV